MNPPAFQRMNELGAAGKPFFFVIDFDLQKPVVLDLNEALNQGFYFTIHGFSNHEPFKLADRLYYFEKYPVSYQTYLKAFKRVQHHILQGNSYLVNLTFPTLVDTNLTLPEIYHHSTARYKLLYFNKFVVFSPEKFIQISDQQIHAFPMKGTIDAQLKNAEKRLRDDQKELAEHHTIVDLLRNDLGMVSRNVSVKNFRYLEKVETNYGSLLQASSHIKGTLPPDYQRHIGDILFQLLPAGSITGAPKEKTIEIIREAENYERGYYTGVMGYFDGEKLDSGVMIRYLETIHPLQTGSAGKEMSSDKGYSSLSGSEKATLVYKSGGGITSVSNPRTEYQEMKDKVYVPVL